VINAVEKVLKDGYRTRDIADSNTASAMILNTEQMGQQLLSALT
jgi:3-isopropylmalate dehydrogenase